MATGGCGGGGEGGSPGEPTGRRARASTCSCSCSCGCATGVSKQFEVGKPDSASLSPQLARGGGLPGTGTATSNWPQQTRHATAQRGNYGMPQPES